jgi:hypothetical protein
LKRISSLCFAFCWDCIPVSKGFFGSFVYVLYMSVMNHYNLSHYHHAFAMWWSLSVTYDRSVIFSGYSGFLRQ